MSEPPCPRRNTYRLRADVLEALRSRRNLPHEQFAEDGGIKPSTYRAWLNGTCAFEGNIRYFATKYGLEPHEIAHDFPVKLEPRQPKPGDQRVLVYVITPPGYRGVVEDTLPLYLKVLEAAKVPVEQNVLDNTYPLKIGWGTS